jgi:hypothetical protein
LYDVELLLVDAESVLKPGAMTVIGVEAINNGNGPTSATMHLVDAPESWTYSIRVDGVIQETNSIDLGVVYSGENSIEVDVILNVPMTEAAGEFHTITLELHPDGQDTDFSDNHLSIDMITGSVKYPEYNGSTLDYHAMVGSTVSLNGTVTNIGNALESSMDVGFELSTSPPTNDVVAFLTAGVGGPTSESGNVLTFPMSAGSTKTIFVDVVVGENVPLNTRIVVTVFVEGGMDSEGEIVRIERQTLITVDQQRKIAMELSSQDNQSDLTFGEFWLNMTSYSTQSEDISYAISHPDNWQVTCDGRLVATNEETNVSLPYSRSTESLKDIRCEVQRLGGAYNGDVLVRASTLDGAIEFTDTRTFSFERPAQEESFLSNNLNGPTIVASVLGFIVLAAILFVIRRQRITVEEDEIFVAGPPISQQQLIQPTAPVEEEVVVQDSPANTGPPLPEEGLPSGWSMEQWVHYGQQYLDRLGKQP